jgi:hypothetical protein
MRRRLLGWLRRASARGEDATLHALAGLPASWQTFRDPEGGGLEHVVVGPGGVFVLDSKLNVAFAARRLRQELQQQTGLGLWVQGVVVVWGEADEGAAEDDRVAYVHGRNLVEWLTGRPGWLSGRQRQLIQLALAAQ